MPKKRNQHLLSISIVFLMLAAGPAFGQNVAENSAGPTQNDVRLRILEPAEGATVVGSSVRVTVSDSVPRPAEESASTATMPNPAFRVYFGNTLKGEIKGGENAVTIENVPVGSHQLVVEAMNSSGEVIDRKEIQFQTVAASSETASSTPMTEEKPKTNPPPVLPQVAPAPEPVTARATVPKPAPATATTTAPEEPSAGAATLPRTGSTAPGTALAGLALVCAGLLVARKPGP